MKVWPELLLFPVWMIFSNIIPSTFTIWIIKTASEIHSTVRQTTRDSHHSLLLWRLTRILNKQPRSKTAHENQYNLKSKLPSSYRIDKNNCLYLSEGFACISFHYTLKINYQSVSTSPRIDKDNNRCLSGCPLKQKKQNLTREIMKLYNSDLRTNSCTPIPPTHLYAYV